LWVTGEGVWQNLDRHVAAKFRVPGTIHFTHPPGAERRLDFVWPEPRAWSKGHEWRDYSAGNAVLAFRLLSPRAFAESGEKIKEFVRETRRALVPFGRNRRRIDPGELRQRLLS
jgi:hypothetical protein